MTIAQAMVAAMPYRWWSSTLGDPEGLAEDPTPDAAGIAAGIGWAVRGVASALPSRPLCLPQAMAGRWMCSRRGVACALVVGAATPQRQGEAGIELHAWLTVAGETVIGGEQAGRFRTLARYT